MNMVIFQFAMLIYQRVVCCMVKHHTIVQAESHPSWRCSTTVIPSDSATIYQPAAATPAWLLLGKPAGKSWKSSGGT